MQNGKDRKLAHCVENMIKSMSETFRELKVQGGYKNPAWVAVSFISSLILS